MLLIDNTLALPSQTFSLHPGPSNSNILDLARQELLDSSEVPDPFWVQEYCSIAPVVCVLVDLVDAEDRKTEVQK